MRLSAEERAVLERHKVDPEIVRELEEARNARELNKSVVRDIKTSLHSLADESFKNMPVVSIVSGRNGFALKNGEVRNHLDAKDRTPVDRIKKWRVFGDIATSSNLDITDAERADIAKKKAERNGYSSKEDLSTVRGITLDVSHVGIATKEPIFTKQEKEENFDNYLFNKYRFFGMTKEEMEEEREKERYIDTREERELEEEYDFGYGLVGRGR